MIQCHSGSNTGTKIGINRYMETEKVIPRARKESSFENVLYRVVCIHGGYITPYYRLSRQQMQSGTQKINKFNEI